MLPLGPLRLTMTLRPIQTLPPGRLGPHEEPQELEVELETEQEVLQQLRHLEHELCAAQRVAVDRHEYGFAVVLVYALALLPPHTPYSPLLASMAPRLERLAAHPPGSSRPGAMESRPCF